jgi:hypothetical protein
MQCFSYRNFLIGMVKPLGSKSLGQAASIEFNGFCLMDEILYFTTPYESPILNEKNETINLFVEVDLFIAN